MLLISVSIINYFINIHLNLLIRTSVINKYLSWRTLQESMLQKTTNSQAPSNLFKNVVPHMYEPD